MLQTIRKTIAGWLLGIRITGPELRALADKIDPRSSSQEWSAGFDAGRTSWLREWRGVGGATPSGAGGAPPVIR